MSDAVVIVESPAKSKTIQGYLGAGFRVVASYGHVRDLPKNDLGVDVDHNFTPTYVIPTKARKTIAMLKKECDRASAVYLATDYDREGEAIAWHVAQAVGIQSQNPVPSATEGSKVKSQKVKKIYRITFHEITKEALKQAIEHSRDIDQNLVDAQQARRVLDRLVGYKLSPFLWKKVYKGLSAGRVQSVAVRLIVDREREIEAFTPQEYWSIVADFLAHTKSFTASLIKLDGKPIEKLTLTNTRDADAAITALKEDEYHVASLDTTHEQKYPYAPYTTSTLQQDASKRLYFSSKQTMKLAQDLYEAGLITYMRTDSTNVSTQAVNAFRKYISATYSEKYLSPKPKVFITKSKGAQEAHEAIRPTNPDTNPDTLGASWSDKHTKLYTLIWRRSIASQMADARIDRQSLVVNGKKSKSLFKTTGQKVVFDGFMKVYPIVIEEKTLPQLTVDEGVDCTKLTPEQHFTQPPGRFTEASLVKELENLGIGRPSTYVPTISTIVDRGYVRVENRTFYPNEVGCIVIDLLKEHFPDIVDATFTATMEDNLDSIADGKQSWTKPIAAFWGPFETLLAAKTKNVEKLDMTKEINEKCPTCGKQLIERLGKFGTFIACSGFPQCKYTRQIQVETGLSCPECKEGNVIERHTRKRNRLFWGCDHYPKCTYATWDNPTKLKSQNSNLKTSTQDQKI